MSAIGGIVCLERRPLSPQLLPQMSRSMILRGKEHRSAYINGNRGVFWNGSLPSEALQPLTLIRDGHPYTVVLDGSLHGIGDWLGVESAMAAESDAELALSCYLAFGADFASHLDGAFALAILDELRGEVILAVDREGRRPLFYTEEDGQFLFASQIRTLFCGISGTPRIDTGRLRAHLLSPCGTYGGGDLYRDIFSLPAGHCGIYSRLGFHIFPYGCEGDRPEKDFRGEILSPPFLFPAGDALRQMLTDLLFAFDYPQFDCFMPSFLSLLRRMSADKKSPPMLRVADAALCMDLGYAYERGDRLGALAGISVSLEAPACISVRQRELKRAERALTALFLSEDTSFFIRLLGENWQESIRSEKNHAKRIRMWGLFYQTLLWEKNYPLLFL